MLRRLKEGGAPATLLLVLVTFSVYLPAIRAGFVWDDPEFVWDNPLIRSPDGVYRFWFTTDWRDYFPLTSTMLWIEWRVFGMDHPWGYHAINILLHAVSAVLLWRLLAHFGLRGAWIAALVFAVHPVNVESVAWITQRKSTLPMVFALLSTLLFFKDRDRPADQSGGGPFRSLLYWLALFSFLLALLAKTSVAMLPVALVILSWWRSGKLTRADFYRTLPFFVLAFALSLVTIWFQHHRAIGDEMVRDDSLLSRLAIAGWALWFYLSKALLPLNLMFSYPRWAADPGNPATYLPGLLFLALITFLWFKRAHAAARAGFTALAIYAAMLFPVLGFFNIYYMRYSLVADHYQYPGIAAIIALMTGLGVSVAGRLRQPAILRIFVALLLPMLCLLTWRHSRIFHDVETLWRDTAEKNPNSWMANNSLGVALLDKGRAREAIPYFAAALKIEPENERTHYNLGNALMNEGRTEEAIPHYLAALHGRPRNEDAVHTNLGAALERLGRAEEAIQHYEAAVRFNSASAKAHYNLGNAELNRGRTQEAIAQFRIVLSLTPDDADAHNNLGVAFFQENAVEAAIPHFREALRLEPEHRDARKNLEVALAHQRQEAP